MLAARTIDMCVRPRSLKAELEAVRAVSEYQISAHDALENGPPPSYPSTTSPQAPHRRHRRKNRDPNSTINLFDSFGRGLGPGGLARARYRRRRPEMKTPFGEMKFILGPQGPFLAAGATALVRGMHAASRRAGGGEAKGVPVAMGRLFHGHRLLIVDRSHKKSISKYFNKCIKLNVQKTQCISPPKW